LNLGGTIESAKAVKIQYDGKILLAGYTNINATTNFFVMRLNSDLSYDTSFGGKGTGYKIVPITSAFNATQDLAGMDVYADGKILIGGSYVFNSNGDQQTTFIKFEVDGSIDTSFASSGFFTYTYPGLSSQIKDFKLDSQNRILFAGNVLGSVRLAGRALANGSGLDTTFAGTGVITGTNYFSDNGQEVMRSLVISSSGNIYMGGSYSSSTTGSNDFVVKYLDNGSLDTSFNGIGKVSVDLTNNILMQKMKLNSLGQVIVTGSNTSSGLTLYTYKINSNGVLDAGFGTSGVFEFAHDSNSYADAFNLLIKKDDRIYVGGSSGYNTLGRAVVFRIW
jgi:uncharacterized delta-60 repeat protein